MSKYIRVSKGFNKQTMIKAEDDLFARINDQDDFYNSLYYYDQEHYDKFLLTKSAAGITGLKTNKIIYDFDSKSDIELARKDAVELSDRLVTSGLNENDFRIYFSGFKGFHIDVRTNQEFTRSEYESILNNTAGDLSTLDKKVTDEQRLFRTPLTKHKNSGLYKIPLSLNALKTMSIDDIKEQARFVDLTQQNNVKTQPVVNLPESILKFKTMSPVAQQKVEVVATGLTYESIDFSKMPKYMKPERWALAQGFFEAGERNDALHVLGASYRALGFDETDTFHLLKSAAEKQSKRTGQPVFQDNEIRNNIIKHIYSPNYKGGVYTVENSDILKKTVERCKIDLVKNESVNRITDVSDRFMQYAKNIRNNTLKTGIAELDENIMITTGMLIGLLGSPGSSKTSWANTIVENMSREGDHVVYFSLDMPDHLLYARYIQKYTGYDIKTLFYKIESGEQDPKLQEAIIKVNENLKNVHLDFRSGLRLEDMDLTIQSYKDTTGHNPRLVVVDYLEKVHGPYTDATANSGFVAARLSDLAKKHDVCLLLLLQPQKAAGDASEPLLSMRKIKGASVIEQDCRVILTIWRPGFYPKDQENDKYVSLAVVKNNMGPTAQFDFHWDGLTGKIGSMNELDRDRFNETLGKIKMMKSNDAAENESPWSK